MGFFDSVKDKAGILAADAERAGKVTAAQARLVVLQNDLKKAERELGRAAFALSELGEIGALDHPELVQAVERVRATASEARAKEAGIAALRGETPPQPETASTQTAAATTGTVSAAAVAASEAPEPSGEPASPDPVPALAIATVQTAAGPVTVAPAQVMAAAEAEAAVEARAEDGAAPETEPDAPIGQHAEGEQDEAPAPGTTRRTPDARSSAAAGKKAADKDVSPKKAGAKKPPAKKAVAKKGPGKKPTSGKGSKAGATPKKTSRPSSAGPRPAGKKRPAGS